MRTETTGTAPTLLVHDGELTEVRKLLGSLCVPFVERRGRLLAEDDPEAWGLVIATPQHLLEPTLDVARVPNKIAVCDRDSQTLRASLRRAGIKTLVRRPVHPAALRGLLLHALYGGPEKRRSPRVNIGAPVTIRCGWRQRPAVLADLSTGGCRLICEATPAQGKTFTLCVPAPVGGGRAFQVKARVLRAGGESGPGFSARFEGVRIREAEHLTRTLQTHAGGPARIDAKPATPASGSDAPAPSKAAAAPREEAPPPIERSREMRHEVDQRVIALAEEATRVLVGRDTSLSGMRVDPNSRLRVGDDLRLAVHVEQLNVPLVVTARVHRDDGERGLVLRFHHLPPETARALDAMLDVLPVIEPTVSHHGAGLIVSEILSA